MLWDLPRRVFAANAAVRNQCVAHWVDILFPNPSHSTAFRRCITHMCVVLEAPARLCSLDSFPPFHTQLLC